MGKPTEAVEDEQKWRPGEQKEEVQQTDIPISTNIHWSTGVNRLTRHDCTIYGSCDALISFLKTQTHYINPDSKAAASLTLSPSPKGTGRGRLGAGWAEGQHVLESHLYLSEQDPSPHRTPIYCTLEMSVLYYRITLAETIMIPWRSLRYLSRLLHTCNPLCP